MSFIYPEYIFLVIAITLVIAWPFIRLKKNLWKFTELYWGKKPSFFNRISFWPFLLGLFGLGLTLLDFRGPERMVEARKQEKSMMILIDNSQSMLCEDVRPNRLSKAVMLARHLVKNSFQTKIAVMLFSEEARKLVPFTTDRDLIDARLMSLQDRTELPSGGTRLKQAMREALQELFVQAGDQGSIVILSDAEGWDESFTLSTSKNVHVAFIAVGTAKGGPIPLRDKRGRFIDHKRVGSEIVNTALDENFLKSLSKDLPNYKYWIANSYSLPTDEVLAFLNQSAKLSDQKSLTRNRDSFYDYFLFTSVIFLIISLLMRRIFRWYVTIMILFFVVNIFSINIFVPKSFANVTNSQEKPKNKANPKPTFSPKTLEYLQLWQKGNLSESEKKDLALDLLKTGFPKEALKLYLEIQGKKELNGDLVDVWNNAAIAKSQDKDLKGGLKKLIELQVFLESAIQTIEAIKTTQENKLKEPIQKLQELVRQNILSLTIKQQQQQEQQQQQQSDSEKSEESQQDQSEDQQQGEESKQQQEQEQKQEQDKNGQGQQKQDDKNKKEEDKSASKKEESEKDKNKDAKENKEEEKGDQTQEQKKSEENESSSGKPEDYKKLPAILKQLMSEDRDLQKQLIDTTTKEKGIGYEKDW